MYIVELLKYGLRSEYLFEFVLSFSGIIIFALWLLKTSFGIKALSDSELRRNNMPFYIPFIIFYFSVITFSIIGYISFQIWGDLGGWQGTIQNNVVMGFSELIIITLILVTAKAYYARGIKGFGLNIRTIHKDLLFGFVNLLAIWPLVMLISIITLEIIRLFQGQEYDMPRHEALRQMIEFPVLRVQIISAITVVIIGPVYEELMFRGMFQTMLRSIIPGRYAAWAAIVLSSVFFILMHANWSHFPILFILGCCMGYSYEKSGSLIRPIIIHALFNGAGVMSNWI